MSRYGSLSAMHHGYFEKSNFPHTRTHKNFVQTYMSKKQCLDLIIGIMHSYKRALKNNKSNPLLMHLKSQIPHYYNYSILVLISQISVINIPPKMLSGC